MMGSIVPASAGRAPAAQPASGQTSSGQTSSVQASSVQAGSGQPGAEAASGAGLFAAALAAFAPGHGEHQTTRGDTRKGPQPDLHAPAQSLTKLKQGAKRGSQPAAGDSPQQQLGQAPALTVPVIPAATVPADALSIAVPAPVAVRATTVTALAEMPASASAAAAALLETTSGAGLAKAGAAGSPTSGGGLGLTVPQSGPIAPMVTPAVPTAIPQTAAARPALEATGASRIRPDVGLAPVRSSAKERPGSANDLGFMTPNMPAPAPGAIAGSLQRPAAAQPPAPFAAQLSKPVFTLATAAPGEHVLTVKVTPESLGPVTVQAHITADGVKVELFAPTDAGRAAVQDVLPELRRDLADAGLGTRLELSERSAPQNNGGQNNSAQNNGAQSNGGQDTRGQPRGRQSRTPPALDAVGAPARRASVLPIGTDTRLDILA